MDNTTYNKEIVQEELVELGNSLQDNGKRINNLLEKLVSFDGAINKEDVTDWNEKILILRELSKNQSSLEDSLEKLGNILVNKNEVPSDKVLFFNDFNF